MAMTLIDYPNFVTYKGQKLIIVASSDNTAEANFKYFVRVTESAPIGVEEPVLYVGLYNANPAGDLIFDLAPIIQEYIKIDHSDENGLIFDAPNASGEFAVECTTASRTIKVYLNEYYGDIPEEYDTGVVVTRRYIDGTFFKKDGYKPSITIIHPSFPLTTKGWHTQRELRGGEIAIKVTDSDSGVMTYDTTASFGQFRYKLFNGSTLISEETISANNSTFSTSKEGMQYLACFPANLSNANSTITEKPSENTWTHYTIQGDAGFAILAMTQPITFVNTPHPCKHTPVQLTWHNPRWAGWEWFRFDGRKTNERVSESKYYNKIIGDYTGSSFTFNPYDRERQAYQVSEKFEYTLKSEYLEFWETELISTIMGSGDVFANIDGQWLPVEVVTNSLTYQTERISKATYVELKIRLA